MEWEPSEDLVRGLFAEVGLNGSGCVQKIEIGFSNHVYAVGDAHILKVGKSEQDEEPLRREVYLCNLLRDRVPAPKIIASGTSEGLVAKVFIIYERIPGSSLYRQWHLFDDTKRRELTQQICGMLRAINETPYEGFAHEFSIDLKTSWRDKIRASTIPHP